MTSEILFQENTEIDSIQQMITTIHNHIAGCLAHLPLQYIGTSERYRLEETIRLEKSIFSYK